MYRKSDEEEEGQREKSKMLKEINILWIFMKNDKM